ncbi:MAG: sulfatase-like hydrolase/transferase [Planctomycetes bacterium]|nr:sulfatase-like hydrolase/transferase [Planctomycetota bacterium]
MPYNIVFIMADQQRYDMLGCNGSTYCRTPNLDKLAESGCRFTNAFTTMPVCTPARATLFTGMWPSSSGYSSNHDNAFRHVRFLGEIFTAAGYMAGYSGKWHLSGTEGGYYEMGRPDGGFLPEYWYDGRCFINDIGKEGFEKWRKGKGLTDNDCWGTKVADRAVDFLAKHHDKPFLFVASFDEPHSPCSAPQRYYDMFEGTTRPWHDNMGDQLEDKPRVHKQHEIMKLGKGRLPLDEPPRNNERYAGCNSYLDDQIGRILDAVDRYCADNTVVVYTVDHGDHLGAHGLLAKGATVYEETVHIPLIIRMPGMAGGASVCESLVSHINIAPTLCELAGIETPGQFQGRPLTQLLESPEDSIQDEVFIEYNRFGTYHHNHCGFVPIRCIRTRKYKLALNLADIDELYDLEADSGEITNRINDPSLADIRNALHDKLLEWMDSREDPLRGEPWYCRPWRADHHIDPAQSNPDRQKHD